MRDATGDALDRALDGLGEYRNRAMTVRMDVTDTASISDARDAIARRFGQVDVLVNNAAVLLVEDEDVLSIPAHAYHDTFETNVFGVIEVCRVFVPERLRGEQHGFRTFHRLAPG